MTTNHATEVSPRRIARIAGILYLVVIVSAGFAEAFARGKLVVRTDAAATAANLLAHQTFYRLGGAADIVNVVCDIALAIFFYVLFKPVNEILALLSTTFKLMGDVMVAVITLTHFAPLVLLQNSQYLSALSTAQLQAQALAWLRLHSQGYNIGMIFFGVHCVLLGYLVYRAPFFPRILGVVLSIAGLCYVTNSFARFVSPPFASHLSPYILWPGILAEASLALALLLARVNIEGKNSRVAHA